MVGVGVRGRELDAESDGVIGSRLVTRRMVKRGGREMEGMG